MLLGAILIGEAIGVFSQNIFWGFLAGLAGILFLALAILHERVALYLFVAMFPLKGFPNDSSCQKSASSVAAHCKRDMRVGQAPNLFMSRINA